VILILIKLFNSYEDVFEFLYFKDLIYALISNTILIFFYSSIQNYNINNAFIIDQIVSFWVLKYKKDNVRY